MSQNTIVEKCKWGVLSEWMCSSTDKQFQNLAEKKKNLNNLSVW